jgi:hypothetical protein
MATPEFKIPRYEPKPIRTAEIPFNGLVGAGAYLTLISGRLMYPYKIVRVKMFFTAAAANLIQHRWFVAGSPAVSTTYWPTDENIFGRESPTATFIGTSLIRQVTCDVRVEDVGTYIKFATYNGLGVPYNANGAITIAREV